MTYRARGRSIIEVVVAIAFVTFLVGFITVLCIGNYFRAKRAQERQRQRREAKLANTQGAMAGAGGYGSPGAPSAGSYEAPMPVTNDGMAAAQAVAV